MTFPLSAFDNVTESSAHKAVSSLLYQPQSVVERLRPVEMFPVDQPLEIELGAGDGSFIVQHASRHPGRNFIAVERLLGRLRKTDRKGQRMGLRNLRAVRMEASYFLEFMVPEASASAIHVYFPDPWPKRRHRKNRLINEEFAKSAAGALSEGGIVHLRTDDADYFAQMKQVFDNASEFSATETDSALASTITDFEREFTRRGVPTLRASFAKVRGKANV